MPRRDALVAIEQLRTNLGLFSFRAGMAKSEEDRGGAGVPQFAVRPGGIVEWLATERGSGAMTLASHLMSASTIDRGVSVVVDSKGECFIPALSGWRIKPSEVMVIRPGSLQETCWSIEQCLRCPGVSATWAWIDERIPARVHRRWQLAAEVGGGLGLFFRPISARREPVWADLRLLVTPRAGGQGETRRVDVDVLYRRGGLGGGVQTWEIDHAAGLMRLVPEMASSAPSARAARA
jgi:hypothetical protein